MYGKDTWNVLNQDYDGLQTLLIYNNAEVSLDLQLNDLPTNKEVILINNYKSKTTRMPYNNLGEIYMDCLDYIEKLGLKPDIVNHMDDDDIYLKIIYLKESKVILEVENLHINLKGHITET